MTPAILLIHRYHLRSSFHDRIPSSLYSTSINTPERVETTTFKLIMDQFRRSRASPPTTQVSSPEHFAKRRRLSPDEVNSEQLGNRYDVGMSFENSTSPATSGSAVTDEFRSRSPDLKVEAADRFRTGISAYDCFRKLSRARKTAAAAAAAAAESPSEAEIEEFFSEAEKYNLEAFSKKYNYDPVNDVPLEGGRYQWILLNP